MVILPDGTAIVMSWKQVKYIKAQSQILWDKGFLT